MRAMPLLYFKVVELRGRTPTGILLVPKNGVNDDMKVMDVLRAVSKGPALHRGAHADNQGDFGGECRIGTASNKPSRAYKPALRSPALAS